MFVFGLCGMTETICKDDLIPRTVMMWSLDFFVAVAVRAITLHYLGANF